MSTIWTLDGLQNLGFSKTIYSYIFPQTRKIYRELNLNQIQDLLEKPILGKQEKIEWDFLDLYQLFIKNHCSLDINQYSYFYPTAGSSEAIRTYIMAQALRGQSFHVFRGEYEGYAAFCEAIGYNVIYHDRDNWQNIVLPPDSVFILSNPSSLDGNVWQDCNGFLKTIRTQGATTAIDICYTGLSSQYLDVDFSLVDVVFFSLSKVLGIYYHRVGGMLSQKPQPALYGNRWFKNIPGLFYAMKLMLSSIQNGNFAENLEKSLDQQSLLNHINQTLNIDIQPSSIFYIGNFANTCNPQLASLLSRNGAATQTRLCYSAVVDNFLLG